MYTPWTSEQTQFPSPQQPSSPSLSVSLCIEKMSHRSCGGGVGVESDIPSMYETGPLIQ